MTPFRLQETKVVDLLPNEAFEGQFIDDAQAELFKVTLPQASPFKITLDNGATPNANEIYVKFSAPPTRGEYDYRFSHMAAANQEILIPMAYVGEWYILVYGNTIHSPGPYTLVAETADLFVESVTPDHHGNAVDAVLTIKGAGFDASSEAVLVAGDDTYAATSTHVNSQTQLTATFAAQSVPAGTYDVYVFDSDSTIAQLKDAFEVYEGSGPELVTKVILPSSLGYHATATLYVEYSNQGDVAMPAPLLELSATQNGLPGAILTLDRSRLTTGFWTATMPEGFSNSVQFLAGGQIPGMLQPGESGRMPIYYAGWQKPWDFTYSLFSFSLGIRRANDAGRVDWSAVNDSMRPSSLTPEQWQPVFNNLILQVGDTWGDYVKMLDENAFYLYQLGARVTDIEEILAFELMQASGLTITRTLASAVDAQVQAPGLPLTLTRSFGTDIPWRFRLGRFGWGWSDNWDWSLSVARDIPGKPGQAGTVTLSGPGGSRRVFQPDSRPGRSYLAQPGDHATLTPLGSGEHSLEDDDGTLRRFRVDGRLDYLQDTHGNRITCEYEGNQLIGLVHSAGPFLAIDYTPAGRVSAIVDSLGRTSSFSYDENGHLVSTTDYRGLKYDYDYYLGQGLSQEHALKEVVNSGGNRTSFTYDESGRLHLKSGGCNGGCGSACSYGPAGEVTATDAFGQHDPALLRPSRPRSEDQGRPGQHHTAGLRRSRPAD